MLHTAMTSLYHFPTSALLLISLLLHIQRAVPTRYHRHPMAPSSFPLRAQRLLPETRRTGWTQHQQRRSRRHSEVEYKEAEETCQSFERQRLLCNEHNLGRTCVCADPRPMEASKGVPSCDEMRAPFPNVPYDSLSEHVLNIGIGFPVPSAFLQHPDEMFVEDLELFTSIPRNSIVILRKGCDPERKVFEFQFGILEEVKKNNSTKAEVEDARHAQLRTLSPEIFLHNFPFMHRNGLLIEHVKPVESIRPVNAEVVAIRWSTPIYFRQFLYVLVGFFVWLSFILLLCLMVKKLVSKFRGYSEIEAQRMDSQSFTSNDSILKERRSACFP